MHLKKETATLPVKIKIESEIIKRKELAAVI